MKKQSVLVFALVLVALMLLSACSFSASTANIKSVTLAKDAEGTAATSQFDPTDTVYALVELANAPDDTALKAVWTAVDVGAAASPNQLIDETELTAGSGTHMFSLAPNSPFPAGSYKVEIYLNDALNNTQNFSVSGTVAQAAEPTTAPAQDSGSADSGQTDAAPAAPAGGAVNTLEDVRRATVRIEAEGSFVHPEYGQVENIAGQGSGFIIDPSGIAVTNNHVVTGAAFLNVYLEGEDQPRNARVLGVSECSDLAVIDIDGDNFPYLEWRTEPVSVGLDMYLAGFPLYGNTEYTLNRGIVSKEKANGETIWSSVDEVIEYDATSNGGNSGGPVVTEDGKVIAVHYAGYAEARQAFGISSQIARGVVEQMRNGTDVDSIGINGRAVANEDGSIVGVWVSSVESGSPADQAGIRGGDIITHLEGLRLATDGTMSDYCDILRSRNADDTMAVEVLRLATGEQLAGQLNGEDLTPVETVAISGDVEQGTDYDAYQTIADNSGQLQVEVPGAWGDIQGDGWTIDGQSIGLGVMAAPSIDGFLNSWDTPGMFFGATSDAGILADPGSLLSSYDLSGSCGYDGRFDYSDSVYTGAYDVYSNCGGTGTYYVVLVALPESGAYVTMVQAQIVSSADEAALDRILNSFIVVE